MQIILELEAEPRGLYTGAIGWFAPGAVGNPCGPNPDLCLSVAIRTVVIDADGRGEMDIGSGIVYDSDPAAEYDECRLKARFLTGLTRDDVLPAERVSSGNAACRARTSGCCRDARTLDSVLRSYEGGYQAICCSDGEQLTKLRPGVDEALDGLREMGLKVGIVTGHEDRFAAPLLRRFGLSAGVDIVVVDGNHHASGDPATCGLLHACELLGVEPSHTLFVGDSLD